MSAQLLLGRYLLLDRLTSRPEAEVWHGEDQLLSAPVVVKQLPLRPDRVEEVSRELAALRRLELPCVARLLDDAVIDGPDGERVALVLERVEGEPWSARAGPVPWSELRPSVLSLLRALRAVHGAGVFHRDLKPEHILERRPGEVVLLDFGLSSGRGVSPGRRSGLGWVGSARYAAPEQLVDGEGADARSDLYAAGLILYERLSGVHPWASLSEEELASPVRPRAPAPLSSVAPQVPVEVAQVIDVLLQKHRRDRPASAEEVLSRLGSGAREELDQALVGWRARRWTRRELISVFAGPERIFRLRSDAVATLFRRAGDQGEDLARELSDWLSTGRAQWRDGAVFITRDALSALSDARDPLPLEPALRLADEAMDQGQLTRAGRLLTDALRQAEVERDQRGVVALLSARVRLALLLGSPRAIELGLYELDRSGLPRAARASLESLLRAARAVRRGEIAEARARLDDVPPLPLEGLDRWRLVLRVELAQFDDDLAEGASVLRVARAWASGWGTETARADLAGWEANLAYRLGDMRRSAAWARYALRHKRHGTGRLSARANLAAALLDGGDLSAAEAEARILLRDALASRHVPTAARAEWVLRSVAYRAGRAQEVDWELADAARTLGGHWGGQIVFTEGAVAWRAGRIAEAERFAQELQPLWGASEDSSVRWMARCVALAWARAPDPEAIQTHAALATGLSLPGLAAQGLGLLAWAAPQQAAGIRALLPSVVLRIPLALRRGRRELMTLDEVHDGIHSSRG